MKRSALMAVLALAVAGPVAADDFNYTFVSADYSFIDSDGLDGDGLGAGVSFAFHENWHGFVGASFTSFDFDIDGTTAQAGVGYNTPVSEAIDLIAQVSYLYADIDTPFGGDSETGYGAAVGFRAHASENLEINGSINYADIGDSSDTGFGLGAIYDFTESFSAGVNASWADDVTGYGVLARFYF